MKLFYLFLAVAFVNTANAQDYCKRVKKEVSANNTQFDFMSPNTAHNNHNMDEISPMYVRRNISKDEEYPADNFFVIFQCKCPVGDIYDVTGGEQVERKETKLQIVFADNSRIADDTVEISHDFTEDRTEAIRYVFYPVSADNVNDFSSKKISKFIIAGQEKVVPADSSTAVMEYVKCIKAVKP